MPDSDSRQRHSELLDKASQNSPLTKVFADAVGDALTLTNYFPITRKGSEYDVFFCKLNKTLMETLEIDREVLTIIADYPEVQPRTLDVAKDLIHQNHPRLYPRLAILIHRDPNGDDRIQEWAGQDLAVLPLFGGPDAPLTQLQDLQALLSERIHKTDAFQITGPVAKDAEFFGRKNEALQLLRSAKQGNIHSLFGIRKAGKTSLINRVVQLATDERTLNVATVDCSLPFFANSDTRTALTTIHSTLQKATVEGYATISDAPKLATFSLHDTLQALQSTEYPTLLIMDEIDHISPYVGSVKWKSQFVDFWQELRGLMQEAPRQDCTLSAFISGVASKPFRSDSVNGRENPVLNFVPDEYLSAFQPKQAHSMIKNLGQRCGLHFDSEALDLWTRATGGFPFWIRMLGSFLHRSIEASVRPTVVDKEELEPLIEEFTAGEGKDLAAVALRNLDRVYPEILELMNKCDELGSLPLTEGRILLNYGLGEQSGLEVQLNGSVLRTALREKAIPGAIEASRVELGQPLHFEQSEWAEELASINKRRNILEAQLRELIRWTLRHQYRAEWKQRMLDCIEQKRRERLSEVSGDKVMSRLNWLDLKQIIEKNWHLFEGDFNDKKRFAEVMDHTNDRPDAHAHEVDAADVALYRRELQWLEDRVQS